MCGIFGVRRELATRERAVAALDSLRWRGPDGGGLVEAGSWWLGAARLAISDASADQPIVDPEQGDVVVFNGAVTSARRERDHLRRAPRTGNDAELLLRRMQERGPERLLEMAGPYAFAVFRAKTGTLWLGVDPCGEKPLWTIRDSAGRLLAFASTPAALRCLGFGARLDDRARALFLRFGVCPRPSAEDPEWRLSGELRGLWRAPGDGPMEHMAASSPGASSSIHGGSADLWGALTAAVARCADTEVSTAVCLSGGIDSSCIAALLPRSQRGGWHGWQFRAVGEPQDERQRARTCAAAFGVRLREVDGTAELLHELPGLIERVGLPLGDPSVLAAFALSRAARRAGVRVLLSGEGADDLLLGYPRHRAARWLPRRGLTWLPLPRRWAEGSDQIARLARACTASQPYDVLLEAVPAAVRRRLVLPELAEVTLPATPESALERARRLDRQLYLRWDLLPKLDTATLAAGVEGRCPFLDPEVLHCRAVNDPDSRRIVGKRALREAAAPWLPAGHLRQPKRGFAIPLDRWLREDDLFADLLRDRRSLERGTIRPAGLAEILDEHRSGRRNHGRALWSLAALELHDRQTEAVAGPPP